MSYFFDSSDEQGIFQNKGNISGNNPFSILIWQKVDSGTNTGSPSAFSICDSNSPDAGVFMNSSFEPGNFFRQTTFFDGPNNSERLDLERMGVSEFYQWQSVILTYSKPNNEFALKMFGEEDTKTALDPGYTPNKTTLGYFGDSTPSGFFDGWLAHFALWDRVLDAGEIADLQAGKNPLDYSTGLISYVPLIAGLDDVTGYYDNLQFRGSSSATLSADNPPVARPNIITVWKWSGNDSGGTPVYDATFEDLADGTTPGTIPTWIKINYAPPPGFGGGLVGGIVGGRQPGDSLLGRDQQGDLTGLTGNLLGNLTGRGNDYDRYDYWP